MTVTGEIEMLKETLCDFHNCIHRRRHYRDGLAYVASIDGQELAEHSAQLCLCDGTRNWCVAGRG